MTGIVDADGIRPFLARLLANCGLPGSRQLGPLRSGPANPSDVLQALRANQFPLLWLRPIGSADCDEVLESKALRRAVRVDQDRHDELLAQVLDVQDEFSRHGIEMMFIKAVDIAPSFPYNTGNQDVLVRPEQAVLARSILRSLGHIEVRHAYERRKYLYRTFPGGKEGLSVHLHEHVGWDGNTFLDADRLWARRVLSRADARLLIPSPEDVVLITTAHAFEEKKQVGLADLVKVRHCMAAYSLDWDYMDLAASSRGWLYQLYAALCLFNHVSRSLWNEELLPGMILARMASVLGQHPLLSALLKRGISADLRNLPFGISFSYVKLCTYRKISTDPALSWRQRASDGLEHTLRGMARKLGLRTQPSMLISLSGIDGSGKTRQAQALREAFTTCEVKANYVWMRGSTSRWLNRVKRVGETALGSHFKGGTQVTDRSVERRQRIRNIDNRWVRMAYRWLHFLELALFYQARVTIPLVLGRVVICDRYIVDHVADWMDLLGDRQASKSCPAHLLKLVTPTPSVGVLLEVPAEVALSRRDGEFPRQSIETRIEMIRALAESHKLQSVDANRPIEQVSEELVLSILSKYLDNHWTLTNALFRYNGVLGPRGLAKGDTQGHGIGRSCA